MEELKIVKTYSNKKVGLNRNQAGAIRKIYLPTSIECIDQDTEVVNFHEYKDFLIIAKKDFDPEKIQIFEKPTMQTLYADMEKMKNDIEELKNKINKL